jgi:diacylglycerol kinase family enzyme
MHSREGIEVELQRGEKNNRKVLINIATIFFIAKFRLNVNPAASIKVLI